MDELHLAFSSNKAYLPWVATAIRSAVVATRDRHVVVHLLHHVDVDAAARDRLATMVQAVGGRLRCWPVEESALGELPSAVMAHGGAISCSRFQLPALLPDVERIVYLDADTLTLQSLAELGDMPLDGAAVGAVRNVVDPAMRPRLVDLGMDDPDRFLNSGVLVMDLARMRAEGSTAALLAFIHDRGEELLWVDQDALNVVLEDRWYELHPRWNAQNSLWDWRFWAEDVFGAERVVAATKHPAVLHFEGPSLCKPWHLLCQHAYVGSYRAELARTPWAGEPWVDRTMATRAISLLPAGHRRAAFLRLLRVRGWMSRRRRSTS